MFRRLYLVIRLPGVLDRIHQVEVPTTTIGRHAGCALHLPSDVVSRSHAVLIQTSDGYLIRDLKSRNGIKLNGLPITESMLDHGTVVEIGPFKLVAFGDLASAEVAADGSEESTRNVPIPVLNNCDWERRVSQLSPTQRRVYDEFLLGLSEKEVAHALQLSIHTVHAHAKAMYPKLRVSSRAELLSLSAGKSTQHEVGS